MIMAIGASRTCRCGASIPPGARCGVCNAERRRKVDKRRGTAAQRGYDARWYNAVALWRAEDPERNLCQPCLKRGLVHPGPITDHIVPHKGNKGLFWARANWQAICEKEHNKKTAREDGGFGNPMRAA